MVFPIFKILLVLSSVVALLFAESKTARSSVEILGHQLKKLTFRLDKIQAKNSENDVKIAHLEAKNSESEARIDHLKERNAENEEKIGNLEAKNSGNEAKIRHLVARNAANEEKIGNLEKKNSKHEKTIHLLEATNEEQDKEIEKLKKKLDETKLETKPKPSDELSKNNEQIELLKENSSLNKERIDILTAKNDDFDIKIKNIEKRNDEQEKKCNEAIKKITTNDSKNEEKIKLLDEENDKISKTIADLDTKCGGNDKKIDALKTQNEERFDVLTGNNNELDSKIKLMESKNIQQDKDIKYLNTTMISSLELVQSTGRSYCERHFNKEECESRAKTTAPSSCRDLAIRGHSSNGLYLLLNPETNKTQTALCLFGNSVSQEVIDDVTTIAETKATSPTTTSTTSPATTKPIKDDSIFDAVKYFTPFNANNFFNRVVTFDASTVNLRGGLNLPSGIFTVPSNGFYKFEAAVLKGMYLQVNGVQIKWNKEENNNPKIPSYVKNIARVTLNAGDKVTLFNYNSNYPVIGDWIVPIELKGYLVNENN